MEKSTAYGHPAQALIEASREADLLVVGSHGHGAFTGMLVGSVSIHCVTNAFCPVVVVRGSNGELSPARCRAPTSRPSTPTGAPPTTCRPARST